MNTKIKVLLILSILFISLKVSADVVVYRTYEDFQNEDGEEYDDYRSYIHTMGSYTIIFMNNGKKVKIRCRDMWGFTYDDVLFRMDGNLATRVVSIGTICYYENGTANLDMIKYKKKTGEFAYGHFCYISKTLDSKLIPMPAVLAGKSEINEFKKQHPECDTLFKCLDNNYHYTKVRPCVEEFEENK